MQETGPTIPPKIQDIVVIDTSRVFYGHNSTRASGQFGAVSYDTNNDDNNKYFSPAYDKPDPDSRFFKAKEEPSEERKRILATIEKLLAHAQQSRISLPEEEKNNTITRVVTNEFLFFTEKPLTVEEFETLQQEIYTLSNKAENQNIHLVLSSFVVSTSDSSKIMNIIPYFQCGERSEVNFIVKHKPSSFDPAYLNLSQEIDGQWCQWVNSANKEDRKLIAGTYIQADGWSSVPLSFQNVIKCTTAANSIFYCGVDICLDHKNGKAKELLVVKLLLERLLIDKEKGCELLHKNYGYSGEIFDLTNDLKYLDKENFAELEQITESLKKLKEQPEEFKALLQELENFKKSLEDPEKQLPSDLVFCSHIVTSNSIGPQPEHTIGEILTHADPAARFQKGKLNGNIFQAIKEEEDKQSVTRIVVDFGAPALKVITTSLSQTDLDSLKQQGIITNESYLEIPTDDDYERFILKFPTSEKQAIPSLQAEPAISISNEVVNDHPPELSEERQASFDEKPIPSTHSTNVSQTEPQTPIKNETIKDDNFNNDATSNKITIELEFDLPRLKAIRTPPVACNQCSLLALNGIHYSPPLPQSSMIADDKSNEQTSKSTQKPALPILNLYNRQRQQENDLKKSDTPKPSPSTNSSYQKNGL